MKHEFENNTPVIIDAGNPSIISSPIDVSGIQGIIRDVNVTIDVNHTWTADLEIFLVGPNDQKIMLVAGEGGRGDNFRETKFDDASTESITGASAPFHGTFHPEESLTVFNNQDPNGTWTLHIEDKAFQDGGSLNHWALSIETGNYVFENRIPVFIDPGPPKTVITSLEVTGMGGLLIEDVNVTVDIDHTWDQDLTITMISPEDRRVVLVDKEGGSRDDFRATTFDDEAEMSITDASAPFSGIFRPEGNLSDFYNKLAGGRWSLEIRDNATHDGGWLNHWSLEFKTRSAAPTPESEFNIQVRFIGGLTANQRSVFELAAARWSEIIIGDLPGVRVNGETIDDVIIEAQGIAIDGRDKILGQAGPTLLRPTTFLPVRGIMSFDTADLARMEEDGSLINVIIHEMAHVLGIGTIWRRLGLLQGGGTVNPVFTGTNAMREYAELTGAGAPTPVPVANTGGPGTRDGHWRESVLGNELMTGFLNSGINPISRITAAALEDLGYQVNYDAADSFIFPTALRLAELGIRAFREDHGGHGIMFFPDQVVLPASALV